jgi:hypothetical protein
LSTDFKRLSAVVHGTPKIGKSWLLESAPGPVLHLDVEGSANHLHRKTITKWNPYEAIPTVNSKGQPLGTNDLIVVRAHAWAEVEAVTQWLLSGQHPFRSFGVDTLTELQKKAKETISLTFDDQRHWGDLLKKMEFTARQWRDLIDHPTNPLFSVIILAQTFEKNGLQRPDVQGALSRSLGSFYDVIGYMRPRLVEGALLPSRELVIAPYPGVEAGDRTDVLTQHYPTGVIPEPDITEMLRLINTAVEAQ